MEKNHQQRGGWFSSKLENFVKKHHHHKQPYKVPAHTFASIQENLKQYTILVPKKEGHDNYNHITEGSLPIDTSTQVTEFRRDEVSIVQDVLKLGEPPERHAHHNMVDAKVQRSCLFEYHGVSRMGIDRTANIPSGDHQHHKHNLHRPDEEEQDEDYNPIYLHDKPTNQEHNNAVDEEDARRPFIASAAVVSNSHDHTCGSNPTYPPYMLKQVVPPKILLEQLDHIYGRGDSSSNHHHDHENDEELNQLWFQAITHLVRECNLLKGLSLSCNQQEPHNHILTLRGMRRGGEEVFLDLEDPKFDSYFYVTDCISETLAQRLQRWKYDETTTTTSSPVAQNQPPTHRHHHHSGDDDHASGRNSPSRLAQWLLSPQKQPTTTSKPATNAPVDVIGLDFRTRLVYAQTLASALAFLHSRGIMVRNLHPTLIGFAASDDRIQIMDLGQALQFQTSSNIDDDNQEAKERNQPPAAAASTTAMLQQQSEHPLFRMTPGCWRVFRYMAPELLTTIHPKPRSMKNAVADGHREQQQQPSPPAYSFKVDSYSFAMICFEMLTLSQPFASFNNKPGQHLVKVCLQPSKTSLRPHLEVYHFPSVLRRLLVQAWHQDASKRLSMEEIHEQVLQLLSKDTTTEKKREKGHQKKPGTHKEKKEKKREKEPSS